MTDENVDREALWESHNYDFNRHRWEPVYAETESVEFLYGARCECGGFIPADNFVDLINSVAASGHFPMGITRHYVSRKK